METEKSIRRVGALAAFGVAGSYIATSVAAVSMPPELQASLGISPHEFWTVLSQDPNAHLAFHWFWVICGLFGVAAVPGISLLVWRLNPGVVLWSGIVAMLGFAVQTRSHLMELAWDRKIIQVYEQADPAFQQAVHVVAGLALDVPDGLMTYAGIGIWVVVVSLLTRSVNHLPVWFSYLGCLAAISLVAGSVGYMFLIKPLLVFSIGVGGFILVPAWFLWGGILARKAT